MRLSDIITPSTISVHVRLTSKAQILQFAAVSLGAQSGLEPGRICEALTAREELGSTGIGKGIALPHVCLTGLDRPYALFCTLARPVDFDAIDNKPVDIVFAIITPVKAGGGSDALAYLAAITRLLKDAGAAQALRRANNVWNVHNIFGKFSPTSALLVS